MKTDLKALIFDVDGTMADTEKYGHLPACNDAIQLMELGFKWSWPEFRDMIHSIPGSAARLQHELIKRNYPASEIERLVEIFSPLKQDLYINNYLPELKLRDGIKEIIAEAVDRKLKLAIVSTSYEGQIKALLNHRLSEYRDYFSVVLGKESGKKTNNGGRLHKMCLERLQVKPEETIMIEDSAEGAKAALDAKISVAVFYNDYTFGSDFGKVKLLAPGLQFFTLSELENICMTNNLT